MDNILATFSPPTSPQPARSGNGKVRARHLLLQRRHRDSFPGEDRALIPSLKVATYDLAPEMKAEAIATLSSKPSTTPHSISSSPTSPTPTWSATPASSSQPSRPARPWTRNWTASTKPSREERKLAHHRGPRQRRAHGRPRDRRPAHRAHHQPRPHDLRQRRRRTLRLRNDGPARHLTHPAAILQEACPKK